MSRIDMLTYTYPRTWAEVVSRHPCTGTESVAITVHRRPLVERAVGVVTTSITIGLVRMCALAYFDVLTK